MAGSALPFTREMVVVHKLFRREFSHGASWVRRVAEGDTKQAQLVYTHMKKDFDLLHHHHEAEDINLWPRLRERAADQQELLDAMEGQHRGIDPALACPGQCAPKHDLVKGLGGILEDVSHLRGCPCGRRRGWRPSPRACGP